MSVKKYYFPYQNFVQPKVYQYSDQKDTNVTMYWHFKTTVKGIDTVLTTYIYNSKMQLTNIYESNLSANGCILKRMLVSRGDTSAVLEYTVKENEVFLWKIKSDQKLFLSFSVSNQDGSESEGCTTERSFGTKKEIKKFNGNEYECMVVKDVIMLNHIRNNINANEEQQRTSFFAKGIGLLEFETFNSNGTSTYFTLKKIMTEEEWRKVILSTTDSISTPTE